MSLEPLCEPNCYVFLYLKVASGPRVKLAGCKSVKTPGGLFYWPYKGGSPGVSLTLCCFVIYSTRRFVKFKSCLVLFCSCVV